MTIISVMRRFENNHMLHVTVIASLAVLLFQVILLAVVVGEFETVQLF